MELFRIRKTVFSMQTVAIMPFFSANPIPPFHRIQITPVLPRQRLVFLPLPSNPMASPGNPLRFCCPIARSLFFPRPKSGLNTLQCSVVLTGFVSLFKLVQIPSKADFWSNLVSFAFICVPRRFCLLLSFVSCAVN